MIATYSARGAFTEAAAPRARLEIGRRPPFRLELAELELAAKTAAPPRG